MFEISVRTSKYRAGRRTFIVATINGKVVRSKMLPGSHDTETTELIANAALAAIKFSSEMSRPLIGAAVVKCDDILL